MPSRPTALTVIAVAAIVLGSLTAMAAFSSQMVRSAASLPQPMSELKDMKGTPPAAMLEAQAEFQRRVLEIVARHRGFFVVVLPFALLTAVALVVGGATALSLRPWSRPILMAGMALAISVEIAQAKPQFDMQLEMADASATMMKTMVAGITATAAGSDSGPAQSMSRTTTAMTNAFAMTGVVMRVFYLVAEIGFFIFGLVYLGRPRTRALFARRT
jgi:hypothetical protein